MVRGMACKVVVRGSSVCSVLYVIYHIFFFDTTDTLYSYYSLSSYHYIYLTLPFPIHPFPIDVATPLHIHIFTYCASIIPPLHECLGYARQGTRSSALLLRRAQDIEFCRMR
jgi:hypothetical protein